MRGKTVSAFPFGGLFDEDPVQTGSTNRPNGARYPKSRAQAHEIAFIGVGKPAVGAIDGALFVTAQIKMPAVVKLELLNQVKKLAGAIWQKQRNVNGQRVVQVSRGVQGAASERDATLGSDEVGGDVQPGLRVLHGALGDSQERSRADVGDSGVVISCHDNGVTDSANVLEDLFELCFPADRGGFDFEVVVNDGEGIARETWDVEVNPKKDPPAHFHFSFDLTVQKQLGSIAADFFDTVGFGEFTVIPIVRLVNELECGGPSDGETGQHSDAEKTFVTCAVGLGGSWFEA